MKTRILKLALFCQAFLFSAHLFSAPPLFDTLGVERLANSIYYVMEGHSFQFTVTARDPDGDVLTYWAEDVPVNWASFDSVTHIFSGVAPEWSDIDSIREKQPGKFDVKFYVTDGIYTVEKVVTLMILDSLWDLDATMTDLVTGRPINSGGAIGTPVDFTVLNDTVVWTNFGGGKNVRKLTIHYLSQQVNFDTIGWECDAIVFLPVNLPDTVGFGALVEGGYSGDFGINVLSLKACAQFDIPVLVFDIDWVQGTGSSLYSEYNGKAMHERDPRYLFLTYSSAHYLRSGDALISVLDSLTPAVVNYNTFKFAFTGHSKFGHTCVATALANPEQVTGFMSSGAMDIDDNGTRLLTKHQGAVSANPGASPAYIGVMVSYFQESLKIKDTPDTNKHTYFIQGTDDAKGILNQYSPKYLSFLITKQVQLTNRRICMVPNAPHTTQTPFHWNFWETLLRKLTLDIPVPEIDSVWYNKNPDEITIEAYINGDNITEVNVWSTTQTDTDTSHWNNFSSQTMSYVSGKYLASLQPDVQSFYIEVKDSSYAATGTVSSEVIAVNKDYKYLHVAPHNISNLEVDTGPHSVYIHWDNPADTDFKGVLIMTDTGNYPQVPFDGVKIYDGDDEEYLHILNDTTGINYYTIFSYDSMGNYSPGIRFNSSGQVSIGENQPDNTKDIALYPNPAAGLLHVQNVKGLSLELIDVSGKTVFSTPENVNNTITIDVSGFPEGIYFLKAHNKSRKVFALKKVIIN